VGQGADKFGKGMFAVLRPGKFMESKANEKAAAAELANAERFRREGMDLAQRLNWEPDYVSDLMGPYQQTQSPVSRGFLESLLTGANPSMVQGTRLGSNRLKAGAQAQFDAQTGGFDQLLARQREVEKQTPWAPGKFAAPAVVRLPPDPPAPPAPPPIDKNASTPEDAARLAEAWGLPQDYVDQLRSGFNQQGSTPEAAAQLAEAWGLPDDYAEQIRAGKARR
jgi:hypothetical protein